MFLLERTSAPPVRHPPARAQAPSRGRTFEHQARRDHTHDASPPRDETRIDTGVDAANAHRRNVDRRTWASSGTPVRAVRRLPPGEAASIMLRAGVVPLEPYPSAMKPWRSLCVDCGAEVTPTLHNVRARGRGCKHCVGREVSAVSDSVSGSSSRSCRRQGSAPIAPFAGSEQGWLSICLACGDEVAPWWSNVRRGKGCSSCGRRKAWQARRDAAARRRATQSAESQPDPRLTETSP
jgi:hypothetical protein